MTGISVLLSWFVDGVARVDFAFLSKFGLLEAFLQTEFRSALLRMAHDFADSVSHRLLRRTSNEVQGRCTLRVVVTLSLWRWPHLTQTKFAILNQVTLPSLIKIVLGPKAQAF
jgi:hypothetical protein